MPETAADPEIELAECVLPAGNLSETLRFFVDTLGFRLDSIMPADDPRIAQLSGYGLRLRLDTAHEGDAGVLRLGTARGVDRAALVAPNRTRIEFGPARLPIRLPPLQPSPGIQHFDDRPGAWKSGRAGMQYRDLIPDRQGGQFIASHIRIPVGGPVGDNVHYHDIRLQLIYCHRGWVRLVYEDQGDPFVMRAGDCVLQPPRIRHRVLESSDGLEVIEIGSPAEHMTHLDHTMQLPTGRRLPARDYDGQRFVFHQAEKARWSHLPDSGWALRDLGLAAATGGLVDARVLRREPASESADVPALQDRMFAFGFVLRGSMSLRVDRLPATRLTAGDAFVVPSGMQPQFDDCSDDGELLQVALPAWQPAMP
ncbi:cupin domain-containing protein [Rhodanobacter ginsengisoli]|uniref:Cupin domain-containing protein n=1 Tax=Rhodanobacter ginsengisoli TaxID=418646 RepID=A0ABW0QJH4_9GAMM